jgi:hypothetical protein
VKRTHVPQTVARVLAVAALREGYIKWHFVHTPLARVSWTGGELMWPCGAHGCASARCLRAPRQLGGGLTDGLPDCGASSGSKACCARCGVKWLGRSIRMAQRCGNGYGSDMQKQRSEEAARHPPSRLGQQGDAT